MQMRNLVLSAVGSAALLVMAANVDAAAWITPSGSTAHYVYSGGQDSDGYFGSPTQVSDGRFEFDPLTFRSISVGNTSNLTTDTLKVTVSTSDQSKSIKTVRLDELGDFVIDNTGGVKAFAGLFVRVLDADWSFATRTYTANFASDPAFPVNGDAMGNWLGNVVVSLPAGARSISITVNNTLQSHSSTGGSALIQKKQVDIVINQVPEPAMLAAIFGGFGFVAARRRKA